MCVFCLSFFSLSVSVYVYITSFISLARSYSDADSMRTDVPVDGTAPRVPCRARILTTRSCTRNRETVATEHPPQDTKIVAGPSSWLTAWLELALVGWLEVRTVVERLVGLEIAWWWVFVEVSEAPPWHLAASNPSRWGCKQQPCPCTSPPFRLCPALRQLMRLSPRAVSSISFLFPSLAPWVRPTRRRRDQRNE